MNKAKNIFTIVFIALISWGILSIIFHGGRRGANLMPTKITPTPTPVAYQPHFVFGRTFRGEASWYSKDYCLGCNPQRLMANKKPLDDDKPTIAMQRLPLGTLVEITNMQNGMIALAMVTDRGGFERLGRIADFTPRVRNLLNCYGTCPDVVIKEIVKIELLPAKMPIQKLLDKNGWIE